MEDHQDRLDQLLSRLHSLAKTQQEFFAEIKQLKEEIDELKASGSTDKPKASQAASEVKATPEPPKQAEPIKEEVKAPAPAPKTAPPKPAAKQPLRRDLEKFIGENLINKIGIIITIIGVAIGAKYSIDHELISPLTRIILGYVMGGALLGIGLKLKKKYENYSAVLVSGAMAIMYFITLVGYSLYALFPQSVGFALMVLFTVFTVVAALNYNRQVIAHIGLVGAYAVPFLLSDGSGQILVLFSYVAIINVGILVVAFKRDWKPLLFAAFALTWLIYGLWFSTDYSSEHFALALTFLSIFFVIFYLSFLAHKLVQGEKFQTDDILLLLFNSFIYYGLGYVILDDDTVGKQLLGLFTVANAAVHFAVSMVIFRRKLADRNLFYFVSGLVLVFITIAIPVQLDGSWVTMVWAGEAALLFWIGRTKGTPVYEKLSYPLMLLAFGSIFQDWTHVYHTYEKGQPETWITPIFNINFLTSVLFLAFFGFINVLNKNSKYPTQVKNADGLLNVANFAIPAIFLVCLYFSIRLEIQTYWEQMYKDSMLIIENTGDEWVGTQRYQDKDLRHYRSIWVVNYGLLFLAVFSFLNMRKFQNKSFGTINLALNIFAMAVFLLQGLYVISELRENYLDQYQAEYYNRSVFSIVVRYISLLFAALMLFACYRYSKWEPFKKGFRKGFDVLLHISIVWIASSELIHWLDIGNSSSEYKLGLSILWGIYSLLVIGLGIWKSKKHLRIGGIILFAVTLLKLFFYDIAHLNTISKTIVFVSLGVLLLIISFLYNKYRNIISNENNG